MGSFSIALTGLQAETESLNTIGNNLSNLNTTAFKGQTTEFSDLFYQQLGSNGAGDALQQGLGTRVSSTDTDFTQGTLQTTGNGNDMAIEGNGFFVTNVNGTDELTRAGDFQLSQTGQLETTDGTAVLGYQAVNQAVSASSPLGTLTLPIGETQSAQATSTFSLTANLDSAATTGTAFSTGLTVYDSLGTSHVVTATFTKTATNQWSYSLGLPSGDATGTPTNTTGTLTFDSSGNLTSPSSPVTGITFPGMADGASDLSMTWNMFSSAGTSLLSQTSTSSGATGSLQNGFASGSYTGFTVATDGTVSAQFSNNQNEVVGQIAVATVANEAGLENAGNNNYLTTASSGQASIGGASTGGRGEIENDELEGSNIDISTEFSDLIVAQRGFEANSKTITTYNTVVQDTLNLIQS
jgi:flagellar hook protein FlgE